MFCRKTMSNLLLVLLISLSTLLLACNPFAPKKRIPEEEELKGPVEAARTPEMLLANLDHAMQDRDMEVYEQILDKNFWFTELSDTDTLNIEWARDVELEAVRRIFGRFTTFEFSFDYEKSRRSTERGLEFPKAHEHDIDGHPDEDWEIFFGPVHMSMLDEENNGFEVDQNMTFKLRQDEDGLWRIIRWIDDPVTAAATGG